MLTFDPQRSGISQSIFDYTPSCHLQKPSKYVDQNEIFSCKIDEKEIHCYFNQDNHAFTLISEGETCIICRQLCELIDQLPQLHHKDNLLKLAKIANFFSQGTQYSVIDNPAEYINEYNQTIKEENVEWEHSPYALCRYGTFDVSAIHLPRLKDNQLIFYVRSRIPYKVTLNYPINSHPQMTYCLLPYL